mgnify:CR=1
NADPSSNSSRNQIVIGHNARGFGDNSASIGNSSTSKIYFGNGNATLYSDGFATSSDFRLKRNIQNLSHGLNFIM